MSGDFNYILMVDLNRPDLNLPAFRNYLNDAIWIKKWAVYRNIPNLLMLQSSLTLRPLREKLDVFLLENFLLVFSPPALIDGRMTSDAWTWLGLTPEQAPLGTSPAHALSLK